MIYYEEGNRAPTIQRLLQEEGISVSRVGVWKFLHRYIKTGTLLRKEGSGRRSKITQEIKVLVEQQMLRDDETTAYQIHRMLNANGFELSISTILRCMQQLGWTFKGSSYCQLIRQANKVKRLEWARQYLNECEDGFTDVIWSDESSIQIETHKRYCYRKKGCAPKTKPR